MFAAVIGTISLLWLAAPRQACAQLSTDDHLADPGFWPTQKGVPRSEYVGTAVCATCHPTIAAEQKATPMANATLYAAQSGILHEHPKLTFAFGDYHYALQTDGAQTTYTLTDGHKILSYPLLWAFGIGRVGQSYLFKKEDGNFYEARVTYFPSLGALEFTPSRALTSAKDAEEAMYRPVPASEVAKCFACHTTASNTGQPLNEKSLMPGVGCEACHSAGAKHVAALQEAKLAGITESGSHSIFNPAQLKPADSVDFCGACHGTFWDVKLAGIRGPSTSRSPSFRLEQSKCWGKGDARLTCMGCHDPHKQLVTEDAEYDHVCLSCHVNAPQAKTTADHPGAACPVKRENCASCHMAKVYVPEMHDNFTDHRIRIARTGEAYPE
jgi:cytochrome c554/c'-like protein